MLNNYFKRVKKSTFAVFIGVYLIMCSVMIYRMPDGYARYKELKQRYEELVREKAALEAKMEEIKKKSEMLNASTPFFVEMVAREKLKMAKKGEIIIKFKKENSSEN